MINILSVYVPGTTETVTKRNVEFTKEHGAEVEFMYAVHEILASWLKVKKLLPVTEIVLLK